MLQRLAGRQAALDGDSEKAVEYFLRAGIDAEAEGFLEEAGQNVLREERWHAAARWLEQLKEYRNFKLLMMEETGLPPAQETESLFQRLINANQNER